MKKKVTIEGIQREVLIKALPHVPFDGWTKTMFDSVCADVEYSKELIESAFPSGVRDLVASFARYIDERMIKQLNVLDTADMRVRDKIKKAVQTRLDILEAYKETERLAIGFWTLPSQTHYGLKSLWQTSDVIWNWAGDVATDYNRYTKRGLLSGVIAKTTLYWLDDHSSSYQGTGSFLDRQISRVLFMGKTIGRAKSVFDRLRGKSSSAF